MLPLLQGRRFRLGWLPQRQVVRAKTNRINWEHAVMLSVDLHADVSVFNCVLMLGV